MTCCRRWTRWRRRSEAKASEFDDVVKAGRTHLMDAVPVTLGQEFAGYAAQIRLGIERVRATLEHVGQIPLGGTATGTGLNTHSEFAGAVRRQLADATGLEISAPARPLRGAGEPRRPGRALRRAQGRRGLADEDRQRHRADGLGPACRPRRAAAAGASEGLLDHARQGQPGDPRGRDPGRRPGDRQRRRDHRRRHPGAVRAQRPGSGDRSQPARLDQAAGLGLPPARRQVRRRDRGEPGDDLAPRRGDAGPGGDGARPAHRLRRRRRDHQGGRRQRPHRCARSRSRRASTPRRSRRRSTTASWPDPTVEPFGAAAGGGPSRGAARRRRGCRRGRAASVRRTTTPTSAASRSPRPAPSERATTIPSPGTPTAAPSSSSGPRSAPRT